MIRLMAPAYRLRLSVLHDAHAKCTPNLRADELTLQVCSISLPPTCYNYVSDKHTVCAVPDFPIQAPVHLYTMMAFMHGNAELCGICNLK